MAAARRVAAPWASSIWMCADAMIRAAQKRSNSMPLLRRNSSVDLWGRTAAAAAAAAVKRATAPAGATTLAPSVKQKPYVRCMYTREQGGGSAASGKREPLLPFQKKLRLADLQAKKQKGEKISMVTAYDVCSTEILDNALIDMLLVGDSLANVVLGLESTAQVDFATMLLFSKYVYRAARRAIVVFDFPYGSYHTPALAVESAIAVVKQTGITTVKFEGFCPETVKALSGHVNVICHLGVQPQTTESMASRGRKAQDAVELLEQSLALEAAGCKMVLLEKVCAEVADAITARLKVPTIGIGSGPGCDGQVLVFHDLFGLSPSTPPFKFVKRYCQLHPQIAAAAAQYKREVDLGLFPGHQHSFFMPPAERQKFFSLLSGSPGPAATPPASLSSSPLGQAAEENSSGLQHERRTETGGAAHAEAAAADPGVVAPAAASSVAHRCVPVGSRSRSDEGSLSIVQQWIRKGLAGPARSSPSTAASALQNVVPAATHAVEAAADASAAEATGRCMARTPGVSTIRAATTAGTHKVAGAAAAAGIGETTVGAGVYRREGAGRGVVATANHSAGVATAAGPREGYAADEKGGDEEAAAAQVTAFLQKTRRVGVRGGGAMGQFVAYALAGVPHLEVTLFTKREELRAAALARGGRLSMRRTCPSEATAEAEGRKGETAVREGGAGGETAEKGEIRHSSEIESSDSAVTELRRHQGAAAVQTSSSGVQTPVAGEQARQVRVVTDEAEIPAGHFDAVIICTKSWQTEEAAAFALEKTATGGVVASVQNGLEPPRLLCEAFRKARQLKKKQQRQQKHQQNEREEQQDVSLVFAPTTYGAREAAPGVALMTGEGDFRICGETPSARIAAAAVAALLRRAGLRVHLKTPGDLLPELWGKAAINACINPLTTVLRCRNKDVAHPALKEIRERVVLETVSVARAQGIPLQREVTEERLDSAIKNTAENISSMLTDVLNGRRTEIDAINGEIVREAKKAGLTVPVVQCLLNLVRFISETSSNARPVDK